MGNIVSFVGKTQWKMRYCIKQGQLLDAVIKLRKATAIFVISVCLSAHMGQLGIHWTEISEI